MLIVVIMPSTIRTLVARMDVLAVVVPVVLLR